MGAGWAMVPLGEVMRTAVDPHKVDASRSYPNLGIYGFGRGVFSKPAIEGTNTSASTLYRVRAGQFIYSRLFAFEGAYSIVPPECDGYFVSNEFPTFDCDPRRLDSRFLSWLFKRPSLWRAIAERSTGMGDRRQRIHPEQVLAEEVPLPALDEQRRIVARIDSLAAKIAEARGLREDAASQTTKLLVAMAHRGDMTRSAKLRDGWRPVRLGDVVEEFSDPHVVTTDRSYPNFGIFSFARGLFPKAPISGLETSATRLYRARTGLFIYSRLFAFEGSYGIVGDEFDGCFVSNEYPMFACKPSDVLPDFLAAYFQSPEVWRAIAEGSSGLGDRRQRVQPAQVLRHEFMLPPMEWQRKIAQVRKSVAAHAAAHSEVVPELDALLPAILDRAFKGGL